MPSLHVTFLCLPLAAAGLLLAGCGRSAEMTTESEAVLHPSSPPAPTTVMTDSLEAENKRLRDQVTALASENRMLTARVAELEARGSSGVVQKSQEQAVASTPTPAARVAPAQAPAAGAPDRMAGYNAALAAFRARDFKDAIRQFEELLDKGIGPDLADNCHYWVGESYYAMKKYDLAVQEFQSVIDFPSSDKANDAMLMMGSAYAAQGKKDQARKTLGDLVRMSPQSSAAKKAKVRLQALEKNNGQ